MLTLPIKKKWFEMIVAGKKKEEYRELKPYYYSRFEKILSKPTKIDEYTGPTFEIVLRNGYSYNSPSARCLCSIYKGYGRTEWGAKEDKQYYVLYIHKILEVRNMLRRK